MHLYSGLHSFLKVRVTSTDCYSGFFFTWMSQLLNFRCLLQAKALSAPIHNACCIPISVTLYLLLVESVLLPFLLYLVKFSRPFLVCKVDFFLSLFPALPGALLLPSLCRLGEFLSLALFFCLPKVVYKIDQRQTYHKKHNLCLVLH